MKASAPERRAQTLERLASQTFDLLVIGAGITGARVALEATRAGASVALVDARDFGAGTSSVSSKLIHGGLRYLQIHDFCLVREAHRERRALLGSVAPHLVRPLTLVLPVYRRGPHRAPTIGAAMLTYSALAGFRHTRTRMVGVTGARRLVPSLNTDGLVVAGIYEDAQTHDSRLVLATVTAAARAGAAVVNHLPVEALEVANGRAVAARAGELRIRCRHVVNAAGPWVDAVRRLEDANARPMARLSKGVHVIVRQPEPWQAGVTTPLPGGRVTFAVPWEGTLMLGTTDSEYLDEAGEVQVEPADVEVVLSEAAVALPAEVIAPDRVLFRFAGVRVLPRGTEPTASAHREELIRVGPAGVVSVAGGKLTTHRQIAVRALQHLERFRGARVSADPLPGAGPVPECPSGVELAVWDHLTHLYGSEAPGVIEAGGFERVHPGGPDVWGQVRYAVDQEWATTVEDVVRRRTTLEVRGLATPAVRDAIAATLAGTGVLKSPYGS